MFAAQLCRNPKPSSEIFFPKILKASSKNLMFFFSSEDREGFFRGVLALYCTTCTVSENDAASLTDLPQLCLALSVAAVRSYGAVCHPNLTLQWK